MRVVALVPGGVDDQILFFPTLDSLRKKYPDAELNVVVRPTSKSAYRVCKSVDEVLTFDYRDRNSPADWANLLGVLRDRYHDAAIMVGQGWGAGLLLWLSGVPVRVGYAGGGASLFLTDAVTLKADQYFVDTYHDLLSSFGINGSSPELSISVPKSDLDWAEAEQKRLGISSYVLIYGGGGSLVGDKSAGDQYSIEHWQAIVQDFQQRQPDLPLVVIQDTEDQKFVPALLNACPGLKVTKPASIGQLAAMIAGANLMLCINSIPMHLAVALQVYTLALFGPENPKNFLPENEKFQALYSPNGQINDIKPETILAKVWDG
jgi:ADP-heptose:LPS heptosyltransferase